MTALASLLKKAFANPIVVTIWTLFAGAFGEEFWTAHQAGHYDWSVKGLESMALAALSTTAIALAHLYLPQPNPTIPATIPPSKTVVDVPAKLEPVDPAAKPVPPETK